MEVVSTTDQTSEIGMQFGFGVLGTITAAIVIFYSSIEGADILVLINGAFISPTNGMLMSVFSSGILRKEGYKTLAKITFCLGIAGIISFFGIFMFNNLLVNSLIAIILLINSAINIFVSIAKVYNFDHPFRKTTQLNGN